ncbi:MAG: ABC transporter ATP-binding protein [Candidatus Bathyarchaeia archaeon]|jgi:putative ABC transport system ATP-binding protein
MTEGEIIEENIVAAHALSKTYLIGADKVEVLKRINLELPKGKFVALCGPSGSGKTTLLNIIGGIDMATSGTIKVADHDLTKLNEEELAEFRCNQTGYVFQSFNLVSTLTVAENIAFPMEWLRKPSQEIEERIQTLLETVGLEHRANHFPSQLSGGEQQRVAFARALANNPPLVLADEPTGNLDRKNAQKIIQIFQLLKSEGKTVIVSTHDQDIRSLADMVLSIEEGRLVKQ